jgi:hypothetical protein
MIRPQEIVVMTVQRRFLVSYGCKREGSVTNVTVSCCCADYATPLYSQKLALTSPTSGGSSVDRVRSRTQATEFVLFMFVCIMLLLNL